jgi:heptosyltransferase-2
VEFKKILIIQTAFIGDVVLTTPLIEKLHHFYPKAEIDFLLRRGNENLLEGHPYIHRLHIWNKKEQKLRNLLKLIKEIRSEKYDLLINVQRFGATGLLTFLSGAKTKVGFDKNPFAFSYDMKIAHEVGNGLHEVERNLSLITQWTDASYVRPKLYFDEEINTRVSVYTNEPYITLAPTSVWFTKQFPAHKWVEFIQQTDFQGRIFLLGGSADFDACEYIRNQSSHPKVENLCGLLSLLESTALMRGAEMNYMNDSAPMHFASAVNAPTTAIFCSTIPEFGFGPLSDKSRVVQVTDKLDCRPCGLHGHSACPKGHFRCAEDIDVRRL